MTANFKIYLRGAIKQFLISLIFPLIFYFIVNDKSFIIPWIVLDFIGLFPGYYKYKDRIIFEKRLKARGLTIEDVNNINFVKKWEEIRQKGVVKYTIIDGGVFFGFFLSLIISIASLITYHGTLDYLRAGPSNMFNFIGYTYLAGAMSSVLIYRVLWVRNEQKFIRLTDPLH